MGSNEDTSEYENICPFNIIIMSDKIYYVNLTMLRLLYIRSALQQKIEPNPPNRFSSAESKTRIESNFVPLDFGSPHLLSAWGTSRFPGLAWPEGGGANLNWPGIPLLEKENLVSAKGGGFEGSNLIQLQKPRLIQSKDNRLMDIRQDSFQPSQDSVLTQIDENWGGVRLSLPLTLKQSVCYSRLKICFKMSCFR
jgi:hypothetical protein